MIIVNGQTANISVKGKQALSVTGSVYTLEVTGAKGNQGIAGEAGPSGPAGPQGPIGPAGPQGVIGLTGPAGPAGPIGESGPIGPAGPQGPIGPAGPSGPSGPSGPQGIQGPKGDKGDTGDEGDKYHTTSLSTLTIVNNGQITLITVDKGLDYSIAQSVIIAYDLTNHMHGEVVSYNEISGSLVVDIKHKEGSGTYSLWNVNLDGAVGIQGPSGPAGPSGPQGAIGPAGPQGDVGPSGPSGPSGPQGATGPAGPAGPSGPEGPAGPSGAQGPAGPQGAIGPSGPAGANGTSFIWEGVYNPATTYDANDVVEYDGSAFICVINGTSGILPSSLSANWDLLAQKGNTGATGATGATGPAGPTGATGPAGSAVIVVTNRQVASYTLVLSDGGKMVEMNVGSANNLTVPLNSSVAFPIGTQILVTQYGAGQTSIQATGGVTIRSANNALKIAVRYSAVSLIKIDTNEWYLFGNLTV